MRKKYPKTLINEKKNILKMTTITLAKPKKKSQILNIKSRITNIIHKVTVLDVIY